VALVVAALVVAVGLWRDLELQKSADWRTYMFFLRLLWSFSFFP
jgi:hypothetical protein